MNHVKKATQPEPSPCSTLLSSERKHRPRVVNSHCICFVETDLNVDFLESDRSSEGSPRDVSCPEVTTDNVLAEDTIHESASDSTLTGRLFRPRSISMDYFNGWRRRGRREKRNSTSEVAALRDQCVQDELGAVHLQRLYQSCGDLLAPLPISDPSLLLLRSPQTLNPTLKNKSGTLTDKEFKFYRNFAGVWRSDPARSEKTEEVYEMFNCSEFLKAEAKKVRNLSIHVKKCGLTTFAQASENLTISESRSWTGVKPLKRRDGREGEAEGWLERYPQGIVLWSRWSDPLQATLCEYLELTADCMHLCLRLQVTTADEKTFNARYISLLS